MQRINSSSVRSVLLLSCLVFAAVSKADEVCETEDYSDCPSPQGWYVGAKLGFSDTDVSNQQLLNAYRNAGLNVSSADADTSDIYQGIELGYQFNPYLALQLAYQDWGERYVKFSGETFDEEEYFDIAEHIYPDTARGPSVDLLLSYPLSQRWRVTGKLAWFKWKRDYTTFNFRQERGNDDIRGTDTILALGVDYRFSENWVLNFSIEQAKLEQYDVRNFMIGVRYFFTQSSDE